jgi:AraC-like DNA-binding protein
LTIRDSCKTLREKERLVPTRLGRSAGLTGYVEVVRSMGLDPYRLAAAEGLPGACLTDPDMRVPAEAIGRLLEVTARRPGAEDLGLRLAESRRLSNLGPIGLVAREQPTVRAALECFHRYVWVQNEALSWRMEDVGDLTLLRLTITADRRPGRQAAELSIGVTVRVLHGLLGERWRPEAIVFQHAAPGRLDTHRRVLGVTPEFSHEFTGVFLLARDLATPIQGADPEMARQMQRFVDQFAPQRQTDTATTVRELVLALLPTGGCNVERVASMMHIDRRTLHRRLADQGLTFTGLVDEIRRQVTDQLLATGNRSLTEVADLLGYSSLSAFSRWRRRHGSARGGSLSLPGA